MYVISKLHPTLEETEEDGYDGLWLNRAAKEEMIKRFYAEKQDTPLCIDHRDTGKTGYVKGENRVGRVCDLFLNKDAELMVKCELSPSHRDGYKEVNQGIHCKKEHWGVSIGLARKRDMTTGKVLQRSLAHVALTNDPAFAKQGTFITHYALNEKDINKAIVKEYANGYFTPELKTKLEGKKRGNLASSTSSALSSLNMDPETKQEEGNMELDNNNRAQGGGGNEAEQQGSTGIEGMNVTQMKDELIRMKQHYKDAGCDFTDMDLAFQERFVDLQKRHTRAISAQNAYVINLCAERKVPEQSKEAIFKILTSTEPAASQLQQTWVDFVGATAEDSRLANERYLQERREKEEAQQRVLTMEKQLQQESFNAQNKRTRAPVAPYNYSSPVHIPVATPKAYAPPQQQQQQRQPASTPTYYSYTEENKVHASVPINNEKVNFLLKNEGRNPYERKSDLSTKSVGTFNHWQQLDLICNSGAPVKLPEFNPPTKSQFS